nr:alpha/beta fold hydrolase [Nocardia sp. 348MFTsu5.1]
MADQDLKNHSAAAVGATEVVSVPTLGGLIDGVAATLSLGPIARTSASFAVEAAKIVAGKSEIAPARGDLRFKDRAWTENPIYSRVAKLYLAGCKATDSMVEAVASNASDERAERTRFVMNVVTSAVAPTNTLLGNPAAIKRTFDTGGVNLVRGFKNLAGDVRHNGGMPSMAKRGALKVGEDLALTPGSVVDKDDVAEVIHYWPTTDTVLERPTLIVPPPIGRYYFLDLRPGRSFVEYGVSRGMQTFIISWRNPSSDQSEWSVDTYAQRILDAIATVREVSGADEVNVIGFCAGGILNTAVLNKLAATGDSSVGSVSYAVTLLDFGQSAPISAFSSARLIDFARWRAKQVGVTSARAMGSAFTWMRPNDLVWNYWVNNYLMGEDPPVFDILAWNADGTNLPGALHRQFLDIFRHNPIPTPGGWTAVGLPVDLRTIKIPAYVVGAVNDHLTPWKGTFRTAELLGGDNTYVLSNAGHIASLVNPPGNPKASYFVGSMDSGGPDEWLEGATKKAGSWWENWADWVTERAGRRVEAPTSLGSAQHPPQCAAPGTYVRQAN